MKRTCIIFSLILLSITFAFAQDHPDASKLISNRMANMKTKLKLTTNENKVFWTAYEQFLQVEINAHETFHKNIEKQGIKLSCPTCAVKEGMTLTDKQITYLYDQKIELRKKLLDNDISFHKKMKSMLTPKHMEDVYKIDEQYKRSMIKQNKASQSGTKTSTQAPQNQKKR